MHYRKQLNFTEEGLRYAQASVERIREFADTLQRKPLPDGEEPEVAERCAEFLRGFEAGLDDDLNTAAALAALFDFIRDINRRLAEGRLRAGERDRALAALRQADQVLDILPAAETGAGADEAVLELVRQREDARKEKRWQDADVLRDRLKEMGVVIKDTPEGTVWKKAGE